MQRPPVSQLSREAVTCLHVLHCVLLRDVRTKPYTHNCTQALRPGVRSSIAAAAGAAGDVQLADGDAVAFGSLALRVISTPGHTSGCICYYLPPAAAGGAGMVFTGDALLIRGCGRTDFQGGELRLSTNLELQRLSASCLCSVSLRLPNIQLHPQAVQDVNGARTLLSCPAPPITPSLTSFARITGSAGQLYDNIHGKIFTLPEDTLVFPGHDYKGRTASSIGEEKAANPRLTKSREEFIELMANLNLPYPKQVCILYPSFWSCLFACALALSLQAGM